MKGKKMTDFIPPENCTYYRTEGVGGEVSENWYSYPDGKLIASRTIRKDGQVETMMHPVDTS